MDKFGGFRIVEIIGLVGILILPGCTIVTKHSLDKLCDYYFAQGKEVGQIKGYNKGYIDGVQDCKEKVKEWKRSSNE